MESKKKYKDNSSSKKGNLKKQKGEESPSYEVWAPLLAQESASGILRIVKELFLIFIVIKLRSAPNSSPVFELLPQILNDMILNKMTEWGSKLH